MIETRHLKNVVIFIQGKIYTGFLLVSFHLVVELTVKEMLCLYYLMV